MSNNLSDINERGGPATLTKACIHCDGLLRVGSIRCRICGSEDPFGRKVTRRRASLFHGLVTILIFLMLFFLVYEFMPTVTLYLRVRR